MTLIEGVGISADKDGEFIIVYTKDIKIAKKLITLDGYRISFIKTDGFKAQ